MYIYISWISREKFEPEPGLYVDFRFKGSGIVTYLSVTSIPKSCETKRGAENERSCMVWCDDSLLGVENAGQWFRRAEVLAGDHKNFDCGRKEVMSKLQCIR